MDKRGKRMNYRKDKYGNELSILGYGCMRFKTKKGNIGKIDIKKAEKEILTAFKNGVNYFDTAYIYPGSESALGEILEKNNIRKKVNIATKLPHYLIKDEKNLDKLFFEQLKRLKTDYIDYYFMHMLSDVETWERLKKLGIVEWIENKKKSGEIRQIGFSYHGNSESFCELVDAYDWDFCMIQYNYMDEYSQAGRKGLIHANKKGLPVMIMEGLRGGRLANNLPKKAVSEFENYKIKHTPVEWAFKWLWNQSEVTVVLSGMNSLEMVEENVKTASKSYVGELSEEENKLFERVVSEINKSMKVGCTGCGYCMPCPKKVDIPGTFSAYNRLYTDSKFTGLKEYVMCTALRKNSAAASNCVGCGKCETHCPQNIEIRKELKKAENELEGVLYKMVSKLAKKFVKF